MNDVELPIASVSTEMGGGAKDSSALRLYMKEVGLVQVLTPAEELELFNQIIHGPEKDRPRAREHMIKANLRLVIKIARDFEDLGMPLLDLINEGNIGLMKAVDKFELGKGGKLSNYARWWIRQAIMRALSSQGRTIRLPPHVFETFSKLGRVDEELHRQLGREPTDEEIAGELGITALRVRKLRLAVTGTTSLQVPMETDEDSFILEQMIPDSSVLPPDVEVEVKVEYAVLRRLVSTLSKREATILTARFGLDGQDEKTLEEIAPLLRVTRERIRQIQNKALRSLRLKLKRLGVEPSVLD
ncbi:MAG: sigma-70 family RNA polymerase sigma factor [Candidatus Taylorbacteria bacterium]